MLEPYILLGDQEEDWKPVIKNFISEAALQGLIDIKSIRPLIQRRYEWDEDNQLVKKETHGSPETRIMLSEEAKKAGYNDPRKLFNDWFNKQGIFKQEKTFE